MEVLALYLRTRWPEGLSLDEAVQLCMHIYCTGDGIPMGLRPLSSRDRLAETFAALAASGWIRRPQPDVDVSTVGFWTTVVSSATKQTPWRYDADEGKMIAARFVASD
jgi:hypothetical protein